jgi:hypothetical protein
MPVSIMLCIGLIRTVMGFRRLLRCRRLRRGDFVFGRVWVPPLLGSDVLWIFGSKYAGAWLALGLPV